MSIIECPNCKKEISDKSEKCIHCGYVLKEKKKFCAECGTKLEYDAEVCSNCGCPVVNEDNKELEQVQVINPKQNKSSSKMIKVIIFLIIIVVVIVSAVVLIKKKKSEIASSLYESNLGIITFDMLDGSVQAEECNNKISKVWSNSIWKEDDPETDKFTKINGVFNDDFNDSLSALFKDPDFIEIRDKVKENQRNVNKLMKEMKNPPKEWQEAYEDLKDYYNDYLTLTNLCTSPSGSYNTYTANFSQADTDVVNGYDKVQNYLDY